MDRKTNRIAAVNSTALNNFDKVISGDMKKFFFVSQVFYPDEISTASLFTDLAVELANAKNLEVEVWCAQPSYTTTDRQPKKRIFKKIKISYISGSNFSKNILAGRIINYLTFSLTLFFKLLFSRNTSPIFTVTNPPFLGVLITIVATIRKRKFIYIVLDIYPDGLVKLGKLSNNNKIVKLWKYLNKNMLLKSERILVLGRDMVKWVEDTCPGSAVKTLYIPHWQEESLIKPIEFKQNPFVLKHKLQNEFVVQYSGNMGLWHDMRTFARVSRAMENSGVTFLFIGDGMRKKELFDEWNEKVPKNTKVFPYQPKEQIGISLTACHLALITLNNGLEGMAVPSKLYGILAAGIPVLGLVPENSEIALVIKEENCGCLVKPGDDSGLINAILELKNNNEKRILFGLNSRHAFEKKYTTSIIADSYLKIVNSL